MHVAFECVTILQKLPLEIECIASSGSTLLVGTNKGHLLVYGIQEIENAAQKERFQVDLQRSDKKIAKKPITQLSIVDEYNILISLSEGVISITDSVTFKPYEPECQVKGSRNVIYFALDLPKKGSGDKIRMCTVSKKGRLQFYYWNKNEFVQLYDDQSCYEVPKTIVWAGDSICVGMRKEYLMINAATGDIKNLIDTGQRKMDPVIFALPNGELALCRDDITVFISTNDPGKFHQKHSVKWSDVPLDIQYSHPYMIAALPKSIEISSRNPSKLVQKVVDTTGVKSLVIASLPYKANDNERLHCYAASSTHIWRLVPSPLNKQIEQLISAKEFEVALTLTDSIVDGDAKVKKVTQIKTLHAFSLFISKSFESSFNIFKEVKTEPTYVIGLYPDLLPEEYRMQLAYPSVPPKLTQGDLEKAFPPLIKYLTEIRTDNLAIKKKDQSKGENVTPESRKRLLQIVETSLLKSYLVTNDKMIAPLLRNSDNNCHLEECERALVKAKKVNELVLLYQSKGIHKKALDLLLRQADLPSGPLRGPEKTIEYLQKLGPDHIQLIFDYSKWVLKQDCANGLKIFTSETQGIEALPRDKVLAYIENNAKSLVIQYLEHIIYEWKEPRPEFHNKLIYCYKDAIEPLLREYLESLPESEPRKRAGKEGGECGNLRAKLLGFLELSNHYTPLKLIRHFPQDILYEERALLLGRGSRHEEALAIYIYILKDSEMAEEYCRKQYSSDSDGNKNVYVSLLKLYLKPRELPFLGLANNVFSDFEMEPNTTAALAVLNQHFDKLDISQTLELLPISTTVNQITSLLMNVFQDKMQQKRNSLVLKSLLHAEHLQVHEQRIYYQSKKCLMTDERACRVCHKRIGTSAFAMYPNGVVVHYYCCKDRRECPPES